VALTLHGTLTALIIRDSYIGCKKNFSIGEIFLYWRVECRASVFVVAAIPVGRLYPSNARLVFMECTSFLIATFNKKLPSLRSALSDPQGSLLQRTLALNSTTYRKSRANCGNWKPLLFLAVAGVLLLLSGAIGYRARYYCVYLTIRKCENTCADNNHYVFSSRHHAQEFRS